jgi:hypothetical protein
MDHDWFRLEMPKLSRDIKRQLSEEFIDKWLSHYYCKNCRSIEFEEYKTDMIAVLKGKK